MKVSVIIPIKNREDLIISTLKSVLNQSLAAYEIILVDDHSTDNYLKVIEPFKKKIILVHCKKNGPGAARNLGFEISTGDYIQFFDSDDLMTINKLDIHAKLLSDSFNSIVIGPYVKAFEMDGSWQQLDAIMQYNNLPSNFRLDEWILRGWCSITQACMFKRDLLKDAGPWREDMMTHEDLEYWFRLSKLNPFPLHTNKACVIYRQHKNQITDNATTYINRVKDGLKALELTEQQKTGSHNLLTDILFKARIYKQQKLVGLHNPTMKNEFFYSVYRLNNKWERKLTRSNWERMHGINTNPEVFKSYLNLL